VLEPISPELVLVDPELGREVRARLLQDLQLQELADLRPSTPTSEPAPEPKPVELQEAVPATPLPEPPGREMAAEPRKRRLAPALLPISLAVNAILIALSVSDARVAQTSPTPPSAIDTTVLHELAPTVSATKTHPSKKTQRRARTAKTSANAPGRAIQSETRGAVEQKLLNLVIQSPASKLPPALIDSSTGLAKNGLQAYCRRSRDSRSFLCVIQPARHKPREGLYARYRVNRKGNGGTLTWYRYRSG
jgi:hypothetical protein